MCIIVFKCVLLIGILDSKVLFRIVLFIELLGTCYVSETVCSYRIIDEWIIK